MSGNLECELDDLIWTIYVCGRVPTQPGKPGIWLFTFPGLEFAQKVRKTWNFNSKPGFLFFIIIKFCVSKFTFQDVIYIKKIIYIFVISTLSTH